jgi:hypothetical protein
MRNSIHELILEYFDDYLPMGDRFYNWCVKPESDFIDSLASLEDLYPYISGSELGYDLVGENDEI